MNSAKQHNSREKGSGAGCDQISSSFKKVLSQRTPALLSGGCPLRVSILRMVTRPPHPLSWKSLGCGPAGYKTTPSRPLASSHAIQQRKVRQRTTALHHHCWDTRHSRSSAWEPGTLEKPTCSLMSIPTSGISSSDAFVHPKSKLFSHSQLCVISRAERKTQLIHFPPERYFKFSNL